MMDAHPSPEAAESILLVDNNPTHLHVLWQTLCGRGLQLLMASSGEEALAIARKAHPALILLDIMLPGIDGFETCRQLKADPATRQAAVLFLSALGDTHDKVHGFELGAVDYITKPCQAEEVIARVTTHLTLQRLQHRLTQRNQELAAANRCIRRIFGRYVSDEVVASVLDDPDGLQLGGEERTVTCLMSDLRGFTAFAERLAPTQVVAFLNRYLDTMVNVIMAYHGTIDDIIGDGIFVLFGAPIQREDDAARAVACAVAMQLAMDEVNAQNSREGLPEVTMGIGLNTGTVVVGNIGSPKRAKYGAVGSHVNLTSRIESSTIGRQILISADTAKATGSRLRIHGAIQVEPKGIHEVLTLYDIGGIGSPYNLFLPEPRNDLVPLETPIALRYTVLEEKHVGRTMFTGRAVKLSTTGMEIRTAHALPALSNVKMWLIDSNGEALPGALDGKVIGPPQGVQRDVSAVSPRWRLKP